MSSAASGTQIAHQPVDQPLRHEEITTPVALANRCGKCSRDFVVDSTGPYYFIGSPSALCRGCVEALLPACELVPLRDADDVAPLFRKPKAKAVVRGSGSRIARK